MSCVLLAERHPGLAEGVRGLLESAFDAVVMVADESSLLESVGRLRPEVAVVDASLAHDRSLHWLRALKVSCPGIRVIILSVHSEPSVRRAMFEAGADAFVLKSVIVTDLLLAVDRLRGEAEAAAAGSPVAQAPAEDGSEERE